MEIVKSVWVDIWKNLSVKSVDIFFLIDSVGSRCLGLCASAHGHNTVRYDQDRSLCRSR